jgi:uncharacterized protein
MKCRSGRSVFAQAALFAIGVLALTVSTARPARAVEADIPRLQAGAERGAIQQEIELAAAYFAGRGVAKDERRAAYWYEKAANSGDPAAQQEIGFFYQAGIGVERDPARAATWFERAVAGGSIPAKVNLGVAYIWGLGVRKDPEFGAQLFREAAEKGNGAGACYLGNAYYFGIGVPKDMKSASHWFETGAKLHDPQAQLAVALLLLQEPDHGASDRAMKLLRDAAKSGLVPAKHELALRLVRKAGSASPPREGIALLEESASQGFWKSNVVLGVLYRDGRGVPKDLATAYLHFRIAALQGGDSGAKLVQNDIHVLQPLLDHSRLELLDAKAADWVSSHNRRLEFVGYPGHDRNFPTFALAFPESGIHAGKVFPAPGSEDLPGDTFQP